MSGIRFIMLDYGIIRNKRKIVIASAEEKSMVDSPIPGFLIQHPVLGNILFDTGNPREGAAVMGERGKEFDFRRIHMVTDCLSELGLTVEDIDHIIISHLHMDHAGGLPCFAGTKAAKEGVIVCEEEAREAFFKVNAAGDPGFYAKSTFSDIPGLRWRLVKGTVELAEDLILFCQRAHTPGVIGLIVKTEHSGNFILTSDSCYSEENYRTKTPPGGIGKQWQEDFLKNLDHLESLREQYKAQLIFGHDVIQAPSMMGKWIG